VQELLGPRCPPRYEESLFSTGDSQWVDDPGVDTGYEPRGGLNWEDRHPGGDVQEELAGLGEETYAADETWVIGVVMGKCEDEVACAFAGDELDSGPGTDGTRSEDELPLSPGDRDEVALL